jgi:hypothetical protein
MTSKSGVLSSAGQAIVQFAVHVLSKVEYAIKFFVSAVTFKGEQSLYLDNASPLKVFLPKARDIVPNDDGKFIDACGNPMPPCIVMEKGESLDRWVQRNRRAMDPFTCMQVRNRWKISLSLYYEYVLLEQSTVCLTSLVAAVAFGQLC